MTNSGLCYLRVPTWAPFGLQFYCNGHGAVARALKREGIGFSAGRQRLFAHRRLWSVHRPWPTR